MPFYKVENDKLILADNIEGLDYSLNEASHGEYRYPIADWYWYTNTEAAILATGKTPE